VLAALACLISCSLAKAFIQPTERKRGRRGEQKKEKVRLQRCTERGYETRKSVMCLRCFFALHCGKAFTTNSKHNQPHGGRGGAQVQTHCSKRKNNYEMILYSRHKFIIHWKNKKTKKEQQKQMSRVGVLKQSKVFILFYS